MKHKHLTLSIIIILLFPSMVIGQWMIHPTDNEVFRLNGTWKNKGGKVIIIHIDKFNTPLDEQDRSYPRLIHTGVSGTITIEGKTHRISVIEEEFSFAMSPKGRLFQKFQLFATGDKWFDEFSMLDIREGKMYLGSRITEDDTFMRIDH